jgi:hypothetical protein
MGAMHQAPVTADVQAAVQRELRHVCALMEQEQKEGQAQFCNSY